LDGIHHCPGKEDALTEGFAGLAETFLRDEGEDLAALGEELGGRGERGGWKGMGFVVDGGRGMFGRGETDVYDFGALHHRIRRKH
jgi:hypothetical protein